MRFSRLALFIVLVAILHAGAAWFYNLPQEVGDDVPARLSSLSFAPFREGFSPLDRIFPHKDHVEEDMRLLAHKTQSVRTYSSLEGMETVPDLARKYGLTLSQGAWLTNNTSSAGKSLNRREVAALIASANAHPDVVKRVIVGNEVLLRNDMEIAPLIQYIRQVKNAIKQPVSYADVWSMYMKYPELIKEVDFITIHILPYWEDEPIPVEQAPEHLEKVVSRVAEEIQGIAPGKPIYIGESGWPAAGRQRGQAVPGVANETRYIRAMVHVARRNGFDYNIVEAFNQPWKSRLEGVVGANWGLFDANRREIVPMTGLVRENPDWVRHFVIATFLWLMLAGYFARQLRELPLPRLLAFLVCTQIFTVSLVTLASTEWYTSYSDWQRAQAALVVLANAFLVVLLAGRCMVLLNDAQQSKQLEKSLRSFYLLLIALALYKTYGLSMYGRYLNFPVQQFAIAALGIPALIICYRLGRGCWEPAFDRLCGAGLHFLRPQIVAALLITAFLAMIIGETRAFMVGGDFIQAHPGFSQGLPVALGYTLKNQQLVLWLACLGTLSIPFWSNGRQRDLQKRGELSNRTV